MNKSYIYLKKVIQERRRRKFWGSFEIFAILYSISEEFQSKNRLWGGRKSKIFACGASNNAKFSPAALADTKLIKAVKLELTSRNKINFEKIRSPVVCVSHHLQLNTSFVWVAGCSHFQTQQTASIIIIYFKYVKLSQSCVLLSLTEIILAVSCRSKNWNDRITTG